MTKKHTLLTTMTILICQANVFFASGKPMITRTNFEMTKRCSNDYLVEGKDFLIFEFEANINDSSYFTNLIFSGPKFYFTWTRNSYSISVSLILLLFSFHIFYFHLFFFFCHPSFSLPTLIS